MARESIFLAPGPSFITPLTAAELNSSARDQVGTANGETDAMQIQMTKELLAAGNGPCQADRRVELNWLPRSSRALPRATGRRLFDVHLGNPK